MSPHRAANWLAALAELVWPLACGGCSTEGVRWCPDCARLLTGPARSTRPVPPPAGLPPVWTVAAYDGAVRNAIVSWKDEGRHDLTGILAEALTTSVLSAARASGVPELWLVPMPSRPAARRARGDDPVRALAARAAAGCRRDGRLVRVLPVLRHVRAVADQSGLDAAARAANVGGAFGLRAAADRILAETPCLLVDDVVTTGATLAEAAAVVRRAGGHPIGAAVVAATYRRLGVPTGS